MPLLFILSTILSSDSASSRRGAAAATGSESTEARSKFGNAKAISSDMFQSGGAPRDPDYRSRLTRFEGQSAISSADLFGDDDPRSSRNKPNAGGGMQGPDLNDLKDSLREGATKVASKLSSVANSVMGSIQVCIYCIRTVVLVYKNLEIISAARGNPLTIICFLVIESRTQYWASILVVATRRTCPLVANAFEAEHRWSVFDSGLLCASLTVLATHDSFFLFLLLGKCFYKYSRRT